jgi:hypothetical protein
MVSLRSASPNFAASSRNARCLPVREAEALVRGVPSSSCGVSALAAAPGVAVGSSFCAVLSCSSGGGARFVLSRLALRALASAPSRAGRAASTVSCGVASVASGAGGSLRRRVLVSRKSRRAASLAAAAFQSGWSGASAEALRANPAFEATCAKSRAGASTPR